ncbi:MAG: acyl-CoA--6-aminopenicillanic acid acyl-transferase [Crocinitomicaceae bacterium]|nr:acyl-CoA--6-aminopenicillanic acid acyl-transferase [Crocinitomicaceae bacterium]|tara:strand:+ start:3133 stop:4815 length:1683 start_codon:yes stop_codon:yes gene_type:complete
MASIQWMLAILLLLTSCDNYYEKRKKPKPDGDTTRLSLKVNEVLTGSQESTFKYIDNSWLRKNRFGLWEMYLDGKPYYRGVNYGLLARELMKNQEAVFYKQIQKIVPDEKKLNRLLKIVAWYNRNLPFYFIPEYQQEILGQSNFLSEEFDWAGPRYFRALNLHGAHDIGHALEDLMLVGCTSFASWGENSKDGKLILGRNFDFYAGEGFSEEKMVVFMKPDQGIPFMLVSWPGFLGAVSGMNINGLTVTINAGKSKIPKKTGTPISILTREILQYASTIEEAIEIAESRTVFVSESILVGSAKDGKAVVIEKSPKKQGVFVSNEQQLVCSNHFQSEAFKKDKKNAEHIEKWHSQYRYDRMNQLLDSTNKVDYMEVANILRDKEGINGKLIGYGNEKAINQMMAHHGIIFKPEDGLVWVSANPYQMGSFVCYDLNKVFKNYAGLKDDKSVDEKEKTIPEDPFIHTKEFQQYLTFRKLEEEVDRRNNDNLLDTLDLETIERFLANNPNYYLNNYKLANYYFNKKMYSQAAKQYELALTKEVTTVYEVEDINKKLKKCRKKIN